MLRHFPANGGGRRSIFDCGVTNCLAGKITTGLRRLRLFPGQRNSEAGKASHFLAKKFNAQPVFRPGRAQFHHVARRTVPLEGATSSRQY